MAQNYDISIAAHGLNRVSQRLALLRGGCGLAEMHNCATQTLHGCCERAAGASAHLIEHGGHDFTLGEDERNGVSCIFKNCIKCPKQSWYTS